MRTLATTVAAAWLAGMSTSARAHARPSPDLARAEARPPPGLGPGLARARPGLGPGLAVSLNVRRISPEMAHTGAGRSRPAPSRGRTGPLPASPRPAPGLGPAVSRPGSGLLPGQPGLLPGVARIGYRGRPPRTEQTMKRLLIVLCCVAGVSSATPTQGARSDEIANVVAFARLYGAVRFFYPADAVTAVDWNGFAVLGVSRVRPAADAGALAA